MHPLPPLPTAVCGSQNHMAWVPSLILSLTNWKTQNVCVASRRLCYLISEVIPIMQVSDRRPSWDPTPESPIRTLIDETAVLLIARAGEGGMKEWLAICRAPGTKGSHPQVRTISCVPQLDAGRSGSTIEVVAWRSQSRVSSRPDL